MNREPVQIMLPPIYAQVLRRWLKDCFADTKHPAVILRGLTKVVLEDVLKQIDDDLTRPCIECTQQDLDDKLPRQEVIFLLSTMKPDDERWVRRDIKTQGLGGRDTDPTVNYQLVCGHWVIDL